MVVFQLARCTFPDDDDDDDDGDDGCHQNLSENRVIL
jgi:hypothetical protein